MPLKDGKENIAANIKELESRHRKPNQAVAIALHNAYKTQIEAPKKTILRKAKSL